MNAGLVGRDAELIRLIAALNEAGEGVGSIVLISGEAGIGKTRLCAELRRSHEVRGGIVLCGRAVPEEASVPYAALADTLRAARRTAPSVWDAARARGEVLWAIAPELAPEGGLPERPVDQAVLFEALLDAMDEAVSEVPALWILDDIHWADDSAWGFVRYAARRIRDLGIVLAVTYRDEEIGPWHPWWPGLVRLQQDPAVLRIPLGRLAAADGERLIRSIAPSLPADTVSEILRRGAGTPLLLEELASLSSRPGRVLPVPDSMRAIVRDRADRLSPHAQLLLEAASVAGLDMDASLLAAVVPEGNPDELIASGLLVRDEDGIRFRHPLIHEAVLAAVPGERRRALHQQIADAMIKSGRHAAEHVATHLEWAGQPGAALAILESAAGEAARTERAARKATLQIGAFELAQRHRSLAGRLADLERTVIGDLFATGRWTELDPLLSAAWSRRHELTARERARLTAVFCQHLFWTNATREALTMATRELESLEREDAMRHAGPLLREVALIAWYAGDGATARHCVDRALEIAASEADVELELRARRTETMIAYGERGYSQTLFAGLHKSIERARAHGLTMPENSTRLLMSLFTAELRGLKEARQLSERTDAWSWLAAMHEAAYYLLEGEHEESEAIFGEIRDGYRLRIPTIAAWVDAKEACLYLHRGDLDDARRLLGGPNASSEAASLGLMGSEWSAARGWLAWEEGHFDEASVRLADAGSASVLAVYNTSSTGPAFLALRVDALMRLGRAEEAAAAISVTESYNISHARFAAAALAAARFRRHPTAEHAQAADTATAGAPWPWLNALVGCWRGEFLQDASAVEAARQKFQVIGARLGVHRAEAVLRSLGVGQSVRAGGVSELSPREIEIARLVADGLTNPAIARQLFLSRATVASHVAHILAKLGFAARSQIAAWVAQRESTR